MPASRKSAKTVPSARPKVPQSQNMTYRKNQIIIKQITVILVKDHSYLYKKQVLQVEVMLLLKPTYRQEGIIPKAMASTTRASYPRRSAEQVASYEFYLLHFSRTSLKHPSFKIAGLHMSLDWIQAPALHRSVMILMCSLIGHRWTNSLLQKGTCTSARQCEANHQHRNNQKSIVAENCSTSFIPAS